MTHLENIDGARCPRRPPLPLGWLHRLRIGLFGTPLNTAITLACGTFLAWAVPPLARWAVFDATWTGTAADCQAGTGACWAFIGDKLPFILFGFYPAEQHWRPALALGLLGALLVASAVPRWWRRGLPVAWAAGLALILWLMTGGAGLPLVMPEAWGGLTLTLLLCVVALAAAFPLGILLALGRRSSMALVRLASIVFIEVVRGVPLVALLYVATLLVPLMLPAGIFLDKLVRTELALLLFTAAYLAEVVRAGLQAVGPGQYEGARSLGLGTWQMMSLVILPQALRTVIPALVTLAIGLLLDTTLVIVVGIFDFLNTAKVSANDPLWYGYFDEAFLFTAAVFFLICTAVSRYSLWLERRLKP